jgi:predicted neutral ceramidase superfamily lipid hydrolase
MKIFLDWFVVLPAIILTCAPVLNYFNITNAFYSRFFYSLIIFMIHKFICYKFVFVEDERK